MVCAIQLGVLNHPDTCARVGREKGVRFEGLDLRWVSLFCLGAHAGLGADWCGQSCTNPVVCPIYVLRTSVDKTAKGSRKCLALRTPGVQRVFLFEPQGRKHPDDAEQTLEDWLEILTVYGNFDIVFDHFSRICKLYIALHVLCAVFFCRGLLGARADRMLIGACNPMLRPGLSSRRGSLPGSGWTRWAPGRPGMPSISRTATRPKTRSPR